MKRLLRAALAGGLALGMAAAVALGWQLGNGAPADRGPQVPRAPQGTRWPAPLGPTATLLPRMESAHQGSAESREASSPSARLLAEPPGVVLELALGHSEPVDEAQGFSPAGWLTPVGEDARWDAMPCQEQTRVLMEPTPFARAHVALQGARLLMLNEDHTLTALNPQGGLARTRLEAIVRLGSPPGDWQLNTSLGLLYVSLPKADKVLMLEPAGLRVRRELKLSDAPGTLAVAAEGRQLWVGGAGSRVRVLDARDGRLLADLPAVEGPHALMPSDGGRRVWLAAPAQPLLAFDTLHLGEVGRLEVGRVNGALAVGRGMVVMGLQGAPELLLVELAHQRMYRVAVGFEPDRLWTDPRARWVFALSREQGKVAVVDLMRRQLHGVLDGLHAPERVAQTGQHVYIASASREEMAVVATEDLELGRSKGARAISTASGGQVGAPPHGSVLAVGALSSQLFVSVPSERAIGVFMPGEPVPVGRIANPVGIPKDMLVAEHALERVAQGRYRVRLGELAPGRYRLHLWLGASRGSACHVVQWQPDAPPATHKGAGAKGAR